MLPGRYATCRATTPFTRVRQSQNGKKNNHGNDNNKAVKFEASPCFDNAVPFDHAGRQITVNFKECYESICLILTQQSTPGPKPSKGGLRDKFIPTSLRPSISMKHLSPSWWSSNQPDEGPHASILLNFAYARRQRNGCAAHFCIVAGAQIEQILRLFWVWSILSSELAPG